jgi:hypothetical protein
LNSCWKWTTPLTSCWSWFVENSNMTSSIGNAVIKSPIYYTSHNTHCRVKCDNHFRVILLIYSRTVSHITLKIPLKCSCCFSTIQPPNYKDENTLKLKNSNNYSVIHRQSSNELCWNSPLIKIASLAVWIRQPIGNQLLLIVHDMKISSVFLLSKFRRCFRIRFDIFYNRSRHMISNQVYPSSFLFLTESNFQRFLTVCD